ncbi:homeobox domain-containing protein [Hirsutella rhossiliensis]|uniref:Homeobox domain-containing protein n=1 Tax=Hirsutella rhossiliensis TaxID=111463 RepID=A0A9P8N5Q6_9HYPO|nr:homeobox domain-containing protein [Hirsutella rhossiliensis]KAH0965127.1 homeobox domain-containing protein [Hirsutella rhossiliensis]
MEERLAARRKMKRFRLTHQQTRFLMSEFAKQPHPDAAHRERLSREIPGLSPRQVQVWFQNRRAKIKRLTADDRDRVVRMRAVPDGFDNVQALHSPYGAVHGLAISASPGDAVSAPYGGQMLRPLMVDVRRQEEAYVTSSALTPSFGGIELGQSGGMSEPFVYVENAQRKRQPPHMRESVGRSTPDSLQSPLRGSMSWKSDSFDYSHYQEAGAASSATDRHPSAYQAGHMGPAPGSGMGGFEPPYPGEPARVRHERRHGGNGLMGAKG